MEPMSEPTNPMSPRQRAQPKRAGSLQGEALRNAAIREILAWPQNHPGERVTWNALAAVFGTTRQALCRKPEVAAAYKKSKKKGESFDPANPNHVVRRVQDQLIEGLMAEIQTLKRERVAWIEKWAQIEQNMYLHGIDPDLLLAPLSQLHREVPRSTRKRRSG